MGFVEATKNYFIKWKDFDTRVSRSEYWWGTLGVLIYREDGFLTATCKAFRTEYHEHGCQCQRYLLTV